MRDGPAASVLLALLAAASSGVAAQPLRAMRALSVADGLSGGFVEAIASDATGFLWAGTSNGLDRYDGVRLVPFDVPGGVRALAPGAAGTVWGAGVEGTWHVDAATGRLRRLRDAADVLPGGGPLAAGVRALAADGRGVWIGTVDRGLVRAVPARGAAAGRPAARGRYRRFGRAAGLPSDSVRALLLPRAAPGEVWVGTPAGVSRLVAATGRVAATLPVGAVVACAEVDAAAGRPAAVWCATRGGALHALDPATGRTLRTVRTDADISALVASPSRPGVVWVGTRGRGLLALDTRTGTVASALDAETAGTLDRSDVIGLAEDRRGLVWFGTSDGLFRADTRPPPFAPGPTLPFPATALHEAPSEPGVLWLGTIRGGLVRLDRATGTTRTWFDAPGSPLSVLFAVHEDRRGRMWLGGPGNERAPGGALVAFDRATGATRRIGIDPRRGAVVFSVADDARRPGVLWVAMQGAGLAEVDADAGRVLRQWAPGAAGRFRLESTVVWASVAGAAGVRWLAADAAGLIRLDVATGALAPVGGCLRGSVVRAVAVGDAASGDGGALWVGRERTGLVRYDVATGRCRAFPPDDGRRTDASAVVPDARGRVWMSTSTGGVVVVDPARGTQTRFTTADGLPSDVYHIPAVGRTAAGEVLLGGPGGFVAFRPEAVQSAGDAARVVVTGRRVDGRAVAGAPGDALTLPHDRNDVAFEFAALDLRRPAANRYRVRLDAAGEPGAWVPLGARADVRFPYLAPGRYTLRVAGAGAGGVWAEAAPVALVVRPPLWLRGYFWALVGLAAVGLVVAAYQVRIRQLLRVEATRRRIADDLHDDIGSKVSTVALRLDLAGRSAALPPETRRQLADLAGTARGVVTDLRDAVWFVDAGHDSLAALVDRVEVAVAQMCADRSFRVDRPAVLPDVTLTMEQRRHLFLWVREALHNACKHGCGEVRVGITVEGRRLGVSVADSGPGFDVAAAPAGRGLTTLAARAAALGGTSAVASTPGRSTAARLSMPLRAPAAKIR